MKRSAARLAFAVPLLFSLLPPFTAIASAAPAVINWSPPGPITFGTALSGAQLDASANVAGTFSYTPPAGTVPALGSLTLGVTFTPTDSADYTAATASASLTVTSVAQAPGPALFASYAVGGSITETTVLGNPTTFASALHDPRGLAFGANGVLYVADYQDSVIFQIATDGTLSTFALGSLATQETGLYNPFGLVLDASGNLYASDFNNGIISRITPGGGVSNFSSGFSQPAGMAFDGSGNLYVAEYGNGVVAKITPGGAVSQVASGFAQPYGLAFGPNGNLYVSDESAGTIWEITPPGAVSAFVSGLHTPRGLLFDSSGNLYVVTGVGPGRSYDIVLVAPTGTVSNVSTLLAGSEYAGEGSFIVFNPTLPPLTAAFTLQPSSQSVSSGQTVVLTGLAPGSSSYQWIGPNGPINSATSATLTLANAYAGESGAYSLAAISSNGVVFSNRVMVNIVPAAPVFAANPAAAVVFNGTSANFSVTTTGTAPVNYQWTFNGVAIPGATNPALALPAASPANAGSYACVASNSGGIATSLSATLTVNTTGPRPAVLTWSPPNPITVGTALSGAQLDASANVAGTFVYSPAAGTVPALGAQTLGVTFTPADTADFTPVTASVSLTVKSGAPPAVPPPNLFVTDEGPLTGIVIPMNPNDRTMVEITPGGNESQFAASLGQPTGMVIGPDGTFYIADYQNSVILRITADGTRSTYASGSIATGHTTGLYQPAGLALDGGGNLYAASQGNGEISEIAPGGTVSTYAAGFLQPEGLAFDGSGNLYVSDGGNGTISRITPNRSVTPFAAGFTAPAGLAFDRAGNLYVVDTGTRTISEISPLGVVSRFASIGQSRGLAFDGTGNLYVISGSAVMAISPSGTVSAYYRSPAFGTSVFDNPAYLAFAPNTPPTFTAQPASQLATAGQTVTLSATASGATSYQWTGPFGVIAGATGATLTLTNAQPSQSGIYSVTTANADGIATSNSITVSIAPQPPAFALNPMAVSVASGRSAVFNAGATGTPPLNYQWTFNGALIVGATDPVLEIPGTSPADAGRYACIASNSAGSVTCASGVLSVVSSSNPGYLINLSARADVGTGNNILIGGFAVGGTGSKQLLVRGMGPALSAFFNIELTAPQLVLLDNGGAIIATNLGWGNAPVAGPSTAAEAPLAAGTSLMNALGAYPYAAGSADTATVLTMPPGNNTAQVSGVGGTSGIALCEIYDADPAPPAARLINISARADVGTGDNILIGGFAVGGATAETVLIRAVGPGLNDTNPAVFPLSSVLNQPVLTLSQGGSAITSNTGWGGDATIAGLFTPLGAFSLNPAHQDSALLVTLPPGNYTAEVSGLNGGVGIALVEIYEVP